MAKKRNSARKAQHGIVVTLEETSKGNLSLVLDTAEKVEGSDPAQWEIVRKLCQP